MSNLITQPQPIYKVNYLVDGVIKKIYVFDGNNTASNDEIFTTNELDFIQQNNIEVSHSSQKIHFDDSIGTIKLKILNEMKNYVSIEEIYMFCHDIESINPVSMYQLITQNNKISLTKTRIEQFISNIVSDIQGNPFPNLPDKTTYTFDDLLDLKIENKKFIINKVLGQKFFIIENEYPFVVDPYKVNKYDTMLERTSTKSLTTLNSNLLLDSNKILYNNIYLCLAKDILKHAQKQNVSEETTMKIYYPFLFKKNILSLEQLERKSETLIENNTNLLNDNVLTYFKTVDLFYDVFKEKKTNLNYVANGIKNIKATIIPAFNVKFPLDVVFKILHADKTKPLIKYNPSLKQENIYRLYANKISTDGRKIPYLKKNTILRAIKTIGKTKSVSVLIQHSIMSIIDENDKNSFVCDFDENGHISISADFENIVTIDDINKMIKEIVNPIIEEVRVYLEQSGYKIKLFESLNDNNVEIKYLTYETKVKIKKPFTPEQISNCTSAVFINESNKFKNETYFRFKRVSNFNKVTSMEAFVLDKRNKGYRGDEIVSELVENYNISNEEALDIIRKIASEAQVERGVRKSEIKIKNNPGFKTNVFVDKETATLTLSVENINDYNYLSTIPIYLDTLIRLTQDQKSTKYPLNDIYKYCVGIGNKIDEKVMEEAVVPMQDIISVIEDKKSNFENPIIDKNTGNVEYIKDDEFSDKSISIDVEQEDKIKNALDLFFGDEEEEEESLEDNEMAGGENTNDDMNDESNVDTYTDNNENENNDNDNNEIKNIDGMSLRNYFQNRIEKKDKALVIKTPIGKYKAYSKVCPSQTKRQPIVLTDDELQQIKDEHPGFLREEDVIKYGSNPNKQFNYMCPRYWCLKTNTLVNPSELEEKIENGKKILVHPTCGKILPEDSDIIIPGHYIYEFYKPTKEKPDHKRFPGLQPDKHPEGFCLPCCFDKWNTPRRKEDTTKCLIKKPQLPINDERKEIEIEKGKEIRKEKEVEKRQKQDEYVKGPEKFPLEQGRWGYLPIAIQLLFNESSEECQISKTNTNLNPDKPCLLRHGVEDNSRQSFLACISDAIFAATVENVIDENGIVMKKQAKIMNIQEFKRERLMKTLDIDNFILYQNGNLVVDFYDSNAINIISEDDLFDANSSFNKNNPSELFSKLDMNKKEDRLFYKKVVFARENFIDFLKDPQSVIDHTYLWDIICKPAPMLFKNGINLVIFEIPDDDITNKVNMICPTNHYSSQFYDENKPTLILIKKYEYYEPVYSYTSNKNDVVKFFKEKSPTLTQTMKDLFEKVIKPFYENMCKPLESIPWKLSVSGMKETNGVIEYTAKRPLLLFDLVKIMKQHNYNIHKFVMNFNSKIIGLIAESPSSITGFVPCYPSSMNNISTIIGKNIEYVPMTDLTLWNNYETTFRFLNDLNNLVNDKKKIIYCKPVFKIVEDEMVVGVLTETNQFIQLSEPVLESNIPSEYDLPSFKNENYFINPNTKKDLIDGKPLQPIQSSDSIITISQEDDVARVEYIKKIKAENKFYNAFRTTIRTLLNDNANVKLRKKIETELSKEYVLYMQKLETIKTLLRELANNKVSFTGNNTYYKMVDQISACIIKSPSQCAKETEIQTQENVCVIEENGTCKLILPEYNLVDSNKQNEIMYYDKISDELIRYNRIKSYMFQPHMYLSFGNIGYNLREDEMIILQSLLTPEYFENLIPLSMDRHIKNNTYDEANPIISQTYDNVVADFKITDVKKREVIEVCEKTEKNKITSGYWNKCFPENYREVEFNKTKYCTFDIMIDIIEKKTSKKYTIAEVKNILFEEYQKYFLIDTNNERKIADILSLEGKQMLVALLKSKKYSFSDIIFNEEYFLTPFDLWLLVNKFEIPCFFISQKTILQTQKRENVFFAYGSSIEQDYVFIVLPGGLEKKKDIPYPLFKYILSDKNDIFISLGSIQNEKCKNNILRAYQNKISIEDFLEIFVKSDFFKPKPNVKLIIEPDSEEEESEPSFEIKVSTKKMKQKTAKPKTKGIIEEVLDVANEIIEGPKLEPDTNKTRKRKPRVKKVVDETGQEKSKPKTKTRRAKN